MYRSVIGIDPGKSGATVWFDGETVEFIKHTETERDIWDFLLANDASSILLEKVASMPGQGVKSTFAFGQSYGFLRGILIAREISFRTIRPVEWQRKLGCLSKGDKKVTRAKAQELFPAIKVTHAIADALLIAYHEFHYPEGS